MRLKWGLGDYVRIGAGFTPYPTEIGVVLKPQSNKTLVLIRGEKKEYPNDGLEYVRPQDVNEETVGDNNQLDKDSGEFFNRAEQDFGGEYVEGEAVEDEPHSFIQKAKEYAKEIVSFVAIATVLVLVILFARGEEGVSINKELDKEINLNNNKISELFDIRKEIDNEIEDIKKENIKLMRAKVDISIK